MNELQTLYMRRQICLKIIAELKEIKDDPRQPDALAEYKRQLSMIDGKIAAIEGKPPPVVVGLKTAVLNFKSDKVRSNDK